MRLSRAADHVVLATAHLAGADDDRFLHVTEIAGGCGISAGQLTKLCGQLVRARVLISERRPAGGFALAKPASQTTLLEIIEAVQGPIDSSLPLVNPGAGQKHVRARLEAICQDIADARRKRLAKAVIADLVG